MWCCCWADATLNAERPFGIMPAFSSLPWLSLCYGPPPLHITACVRTNCAAFTLIPVLFSGLYKLLHGYSDKSAYALCQFAYHSGKEGEDVKLFTGRTDGIIVEPRGPRTFGWDPCFQPDGFTETYAELAKEVKNSISHRYKALDQIRDFFIEESAKQNGQT